VTGLLAGVAAVFAIALAVAARRLAIARRALDTSVRAAAGPDVRSGAAEREALRLGRILASMPDGVLVIEGDEVVYANPAAARLLGGDPVRIVPTVRSSPRSNMLITVHHPTYREVRCTRTQLDTGSLLVVARDVTEARRLDRMRHDFVANASHELKTPVAAILATAETLRASIDDDPAASQRFVDALGREATRLSEIVQDLLDLARLDQDAESGAEAADAATVVGEVAAEFRQRGRERGVEVAAIMPPSARVAVRAPDLVLAVRNLLDNALRYTSVGGTITVALASEGSIVTLSVTDTGEGIPAKDLARIFERFYRVDRARSRDTGGTGLGLAIVKHVVETAGGTVSVDSTFGSGSTFTLRLPVAE
jgi:signal transduction histidine kinase